MTTARTPPSPVPSPSAGAARTASAEVTAVPPRPRPRGRLPRRVPVRQVLCLVALVLVAVAAVRHRSVLAEGVGRLRTASRPRLLAAAGATCPTWVAAAFTRQGAVVRPPPEGRLPATRSAAGAAGHLLPAGIGSVEAALIVALVAVGGPAAVGTAVVPAYRVITVWVPLVPGR